MKAKIVTAVLLSICVLMAAFTSGMFSKDVDHEVVVETNITNSYPDEVAPNDEANESILEIHFIDVGQADATLIMCDGEAMLIDAADNDSGSQVQLYLKKRVQRLTCLLYRLNKIQSNQSQAGSQCRPKAILHFSFLNS